MQLETWPGSVSGSHRSSSTKISRNLEADGSEFIIFSHSKIIHVSQQHHCRATGEISKRYEISIFYPAASRIYENLRYGHSYTSETHPDTIHTAMFFKCVVLRKGRNPDKTRHERFEWYSSVVSCTGLFWLSSCIGPISRNSTNKIYWNSWQAVNFLVSEWHFVHVDELVKTTYENTGQFGHIKDIL